MTTQPAWQALVAKGRKVEHHRPWPRAIVNEDAWNNAVEGLAEERWTLAGLWGEEDAVHMALTNSAQMAVLTLPCPSRRFSSVGLSHPPAIRLERTIHDLYGLLPEGPTDLRPWLDHGRWGVSHPLGRRELAISQPYPFLSAQGEDLHQIAVGPVHAGTIEPGHFRFHVNGETVVRLEARLGYTHKGVEGLMRGAELEHAGRLAGRISGDSTVAYAIAFSRAAEAALNIEAPRRAHFLRALMGELERLANHLGDIGAICNDAAFAFMHAHCGVLRERVLRAADLCFGHRLMRDCVVPGGTTIDCAAEGLAALRGLVREVRRRFPALVELYDNTASLQDRTVGTGVLQPELARNYACGGYVGRASGRSFDARRAAGYPPYDVLRFEVPVLTTGDVNARVWIRIREVEQSLSLVEQIMELPPA